MGIYGETLIIVRDVYTKKIYIKKVQDILGIDIKSCNYQIWTNIGWSKIKNIQEELNFSPICTIQSDVGNLTITLDLINKITQLSLPKQNLDDKWKITHEQAFLLGYFLKYGVLDYNRLNLIIRDTSISHKYIKQFLEIFDKVECIKSSYEKIDNNRYIIRNIYEKLIWNKYFSFCYNLENEKIIPNIILNSDLLIQTCFILGYLGELNYDKKDPLQYLTRCLDDRIITTYSEQLLMGLYFICKNIGINITTGFFIKDNKWFHYIKKSKQNDNERNTYNVENKLINSHNKTSKTSKTSNTSKTYIIIPENPNVNTIALGIGEFGIVIK